MKSPGADLVQHLFGEIQDQLIQLLRQLTPDEWAAPTVCTGWSVKDVALHLLGGDIGWLSRGRDADDSGRLPLGKDLVAALNLWNERWVEAARGMSTTVLVDLLTHLGKQTIAYLESEDPFGPGAVVSWAGPDPAPAWLDIARDYTERWHHQQHIRDAAGRPGLTEPRYLAPVLATFMWALPHTFRDVPAPAGTTVGLTISGDAGGTWYVIRGADRWSLSVETDAQPAALVRIDQDMAWRLFTKGIPKSQALARSAIKGDQALALKVFDTVSIIA